MQEGDFSYANLANAAFLEELYSRYLKDPKSVDPTWKYFFSGMEFSSIGGEEAGSLSIFRLIQAYRIHGHKKAFSSPLIAKKEEVKDLDLSNFGLGVKDLERPFSTFGLLLEKQAPLSQIIKHLETIYCGSVGYEFMGLGSKTESWMLSLLEGKRASFSKEEKEKILDDLTSAELFEHFIHTKYPGQTRFSLEGGETFVPLLKALIETGAEAKAEDIFIGMAHRGRLNVLAHVLEKPYTQIFHEFEDTAQEDGSGDVKYHKGAHANLKTLSGHFIEVALAPNPSHLESVDPIVEGQTRAKQELKKDVDLRKTVIPILVHGDASLAGQGVVYEILQMRALKGYMTGGTIHIVINNNIGYTTLPEDGRSTSYCTDIAKTFGAPVFHVNAEDPESCVMAAALAMKFRQTFHIDVFIDLNCYRKHGHNEGDEPTFTQPLEYKTIKEKKSIRELFNQKLLQEGVLTEEEIQKKEAFVSRKLQEALNAALSQRKNKTEKELFQNVQKENVPAISAETLRELAESFCMVPKGFHIHPKLQRLLGERLKLEKIDWGMGEHLAFASLLFEKIHVRLSGQDVERGTFSHRHCIWVDGETGEKYSPLNHLSKSQAPFAVYNSLLSEFAVMGFDLGYSLSYPKSLVLWEAQFGDFVNGSQVIIDQYLATSEQKWARRSNLTLLLPHGYEGKGPEHSSARMERFLQLCAEDNLIVANCTTPAQFFHLLRRQAYLPAKRPLIVFTPKLLLRHPACTSCLDDFTSSTFLEVLNDPTPPKNPTRILFCSGKVFYDLVEEREKRKDDTSLIIRLEQLYPFPKEEILKVLKAYPSAQKLIMWVQEEQKNMGAWSYILVKFLELLGKTITYVGRKESASPAAGSYSLHKKQYEAFMQEAFFLDNEAKQ